MEANYLISQLQSIWDYNSSQYLSKTNLEFSKNFCEIINKYYSTMQLPISTRINPLYLTAKNILLEDIYRITNSFAFREEISNVLEKFHRKVMLGVDTLGIYNTLNLTHINLYNCFGYNKTVLQICTDFGIKYDTWVHKTYSIQTQSHITIFWR